jgi:V8-like Glu-specific endopeptidase
MGKESTLLPISFLEQGLNCARAVVRINIGTALGTGFLVEKNYLITNNHVIPDLATATNAKVQFNYQSNWQGVILEPELYTLDAHSHTQHFVTDPFHDYTIVKLNGDANSKYGQLTLGDMIPKKDDFVNIIQHPAGGLKQIAMYHNVIMYIDDSRVQYLTDTLPGSSGSPVFDSKWNVVALHHSGGYLKEPGLNQPVFRNEGINIQLVKRALLNLLT